jgi:hypothetical protein
MHIAALIDEQMLKLSDAFEMAEIPGFVPRINLELEVRVVNINKGRNEIIANRCKELSDYSAFIAKFRALETELQDKEKALKTAIHYCMKHDILKLFLETHSSEVFNMLITEWNTEEAKQVWFEEGMELGIEKGMVEGREESRLDVARNALAAGAAPEFIQKITGLDLETIKSLLTGN